MREFHSCSPPRPVESRFFGGSGKPFLWVQSLLKLASTKPPCPTLSTISKLLRVASLQKKSMFLGGVEGWLDVSLAVMREQKIHRRCGDGRDSFLRVLGWLPGTSAVFATMRSTPRRAAGVLRSSTCSITHEILVKDSNDKKQNIIIDTSYMTLKKYVCRICIICFKNIYISNSELV